MHILTSCELHLYKAERLQHPSGYIIGVMHTHGALTVYTAIQAYKLTFWPCNISESVKCEPGLNACQR